MATSRPKTTRAQTKPYVALVADGKPAAEQAVAKVAATAKSVTAAAPVAVNRLEQVMQINKDQFEKASKAAFTQFDEMVGFGQGNVEAVVKASNVFAKGVEELTKAFITFTQSNIETSVATTKAAMGCTSLRQVVDLQTDFAKSSFDQLMAEGSKLSEMSLKVTNEAIAPLQSRMNLAVEKFMKPMAA